MRLDPQLAADTYVLGYYPRTAVLLHRNASVPWVILVPDTSTTELLELPAADRERLLGYASRVAAFIKTEFAVSRINVAAIGNIVSQLHLHVVGRTEQDSCWPKPVWGHLSVHVDYAPTQLETLRTLAVSQLGLSVDPNTAS